MKEAIFHVDERPDLKLAFGLRNDNENYPAPWVYALYLDAEIAKRPIILMQTSACISPACSFHDFLGMCGRLSSFIHATMLLDCFRYDVLYPDTCNLGMLIKKVRGEYTSWAPSSIVDDLLRESHGMLLWNDQLERLLACAGVLDLGERFKMRRELNAKLAEAWGFTKHYILPDGLSVGRVMDERMLPNQCTSGGNWGGAIKLYRYIEDQH